MDNRSIIYGSDKKMKCPSCGGNNLSITNQLPKMWTCHECGTEFRDLTAFKKEIDSTETRVKFFVGVGIFLIIAGYLLYKLGEKLNESFVTVLGIIAFPFAILYFYFAWKTYSNKSTKQAEYDDLAKKVRGE